ncbi:MAG: hypothetical protein KJ915_00060 [Candidatus Omnitrophica bacterium]|nr:hypothetical protein [Candidatus Omnitrophota bacterium]
MKSLFCKSGIYLIFLIFFYILFIAGNTLLFACSETRYNDFLLKNSRIILQTGSLRAGELINTLNPELIVDKESVLISFEAVYNRIDYLIRDKIPDVFLRNNQIPILHKAKKSERKALGLKIMVKEMAKLRQALDSGTEKEVLSGIAETIDIIEQVLYPESSFSVGTFPIERKLLRDWITKLFFWINYDEYSSHGMEGVLNGVIRGYVEHAKAYVQQHDLEQELESIRSQTNEKLGGFKNLFVLKDLVPIDLINQAI